MPNFQSRINTALGTASSIRGQLIRGGIGIAGVRFSNAILTFLTSVILARALGTSDFGVYSFVYALIMLLCVPIQQGLAKLVIRETASAESNKDWNLMRGLWLWSTYTSLVYSVFIFILVSILVWFFKNEINHQKAITIMTALLLLPLINQISLKSSALMGLRRVAIGPLPDSVLRPGLFIFFILFVIAVLPNTELTPSNAMGIHAIAALLAFVAGVTILYRLQPQPLVSRPKPAFKSNIWVKAALPLALIAGLQVINTYTDIVMLGILRTSDEVGIYRVVAQSGMLVAFVMQTVGMIAGPYLARFYSQKDHHNLQRIFTICTRAIFVISLPIALALSIWGSQLLGLLFGEEYIKGYSALIILSTGLLLFNIIGPVGLLLEMTGHEKQAAFRMAFTAILNVILNAALIPKFGINGAAMATIISLIISQIILRKFVSTQLGIECSLLSVRK